MLRSISSAATVILSCALVSFACAGDEPAGAQGAAARELAAHTAEFKRDIVKVTEGVYVAIGYGLANSVLLVGPDGTVVIDVMESNEAGSPVKKAFDKISAKPLRAIIYTHFHTDHVSGIDAFLNKGDVDIYAHDKTMAEMDRVATVTQEITYRRSMRMFGTFVPKKDFVNSGIGPELLFNDKTVMSYRRANKTFSGERMKMRAAGIDLELIHAPGETDDQIVVWLPAKKVLIAADDFYRSFPNLYTIRGTRYRDVQVWARSLETMRKLGAEFMVPCHSRPVTGAAVISGTLADYRDAIQYVHDQTVRGMNRGLTADEIVELVRLPKHLAEKPYLREFYGTVRWSVRNIFGGYLGWFSGDAAALNPLPPTERAARMASLAGGKGKLLDRAQEALEKGDHQWALELAGHLLALKPGMKDALGIRSACFRELAARSGNANERNYYLSQALEADGKLTLGRPRVTPDLARRIPLAAIFAGMGVRLNPEKSADVRQTVGFRFPDTGEAYTVQVRRGVAFIEPVFPAKADITVSLSSSLWKEIAAQTANPAVALAKGDVKIEGGLVNLVKFLSLFRD
ncbi:MAG TPA: alkyl sulfatase dimerization domain-containing protein [Spirochaetota bacterium]|nr:MBL fold metallo-hydrolase [Spirochaetota bacterium]HOD15199.1 alkyl sulfatase dimerization domain-containing protein [Spirochaetota bacterium]HPG50379.1 alkyl sulfatase dimerization domain-containing protein [Spirochaetota bacterium]HPN10904.1 alkyl sulfatase dimerization domain-containing protein [Spirochaetota bacterium]HQL80607.1 alkyl sulfatase dimerization domain-containing protein [Spirochaetota bacterium]